MAKNDGRPDPGGILPPDAWERLEPFFRPHPSRVLVIRAADRRNGTDILAEIARRRSNPGVVVIAPEGAPGAVHSDSMSAGLPSSWWVLRTSDDLAPIAATAAALRLIDTLVREAGNEPMVPSLWLPPPILEGYSLLPKAPEVFLAVNSWDGLLEAYLKGIRSRAGETPNEEDLERILLRSSEDYLTVHLIVVTRRPHSVLEHGADFVIEAPESAAGLPPRIEVRVAHPGGRDSESAH
jgi:hypothetical protein